MRDWPAFLELKKTIDDFNESCPLLEAMSNKALIDRHWEQISQVCGVHFDVQNEAFLLRNIMEAPLLENKEVLLMILVSISISKSNQMVIIREHSVR